MKPSAENLEKLRARHAEAQAQADTLKAKIIRMESSLSGDPAPQTGLDMLWKAAPQMARTRSSKQLCRIAYNRIPAHERPRLSVLLTALRAWARCDEWRKDDGQFVPALHRWIKDRRYEDLPEDARPFRRAPASAPIVHHPPPGDEAASPEDIAAVLAQLGQNPAMPNP